MILRGPNGAQKGSFRWVALLLILSAAWGNQIAAQDGGTPFTLHVYANLVQLPTLVLDSQHRLMAALDPRQFEVSLDSGRQFAPTHVRMEGEDPIDLAIVLDLSGSQDSLLKGFADAAANLVPGSLHPQDRIWVYAVNCSLIRYAEGAPATHDVLHRVLTNAVQRSSADKPHPGSSCSKPAPLWAVVATVVEQMTDAPGRRVMLVMSDGLDGGSKYGWAAVHYLAGTRGVALFGLLDVSDLRVRNFVRDPVPRDFRQLCESSGGIVMESSAKRLPATFQEFMAMLRGRYILEFPSPQRLTSGTHSVDVKLKRKRNAFIAVAGVTVAMRDPSLANDPTTIPSQAGADIPVGDKRPEVTR